MSTLPVDPQMQWPHRKAGCAMTPASGITSTNDVFAIVATQKKGSIYGTITYTEHKYESNGESEGAKQRTD